MSGVASELPRLNFALAYGDMIDVGLEHYGEFIVTTEYAQHLMNGGMTRVDGRPGRLVQVDTFQNAVQLRWVFDDHPDARVLPQIRRVA